MSLFRTNREKNAAVDEARREKNIYTASQAKLVAMRFFRHRLALLGLIVLSLFYLSAIFAPFLSINDPAKCYDAYTYCFPQGLRLWDDNGFSWRPFYYKIEKERDPITLAMKYKLNEEERVYVSFFSKGYAYKLFGLIPTDIHLIAASDEAPLFLFGTDNMGRDLFARNMYASRISLTIGLVGVAITFIFGCAFGGVAGYYGGWVDNAICRMIEFLMAIPTMPLWMALSAALPREWSQMQLYFAITIILALSNWTGLARIVRGKLISIRGEDYVTAAVLSGVSDKKNHPKAHASEFFELSHRQHHHEHPDDDPGRNGAFVSGAGTSVPDHQLGRSLKRRAERQGDFTKSVGNAARPFCGDSGTRI